MKNIVRTPQSPPTIHPVPDDGTPRPLWSVMIPTYNCLKYLGDTLNHVLEQALSEDEMQIEVVDDASTDGDVEALVNEIGKGRVKFYRQASNVGSLRNMETCINRARGYWVHLLHGDDFVLPGFYTAIKSLFEQFPESGAAFTGFKYINYQNKELWPGIKLAEEPCILDNFLVRLAHGQLLQPPSIVVKRSTYEDVGSFYAVHYGEDWNMWMTIAAKYPVAHAPDLLARYRIHHNNITTRSLKDGQNIKDILKVIDIAQDLLGDYPNKSEIKKQAIKSYAIYFAQSSDNLYNVSPDAALLQVKEAISLNFNAYTAYYFFKTLFKRFIGYKMNPDKRQLEL